MKWLDFQASTILLSKLGLEIQSYALVLPSEVSFFLFNPVGTRPQEMDIREEWDRKIEEGYIPLIQLSSQQSSNEDIIKIVNYLISSQYLAERSENNIKFLQLNPGKSPIDFLIGLLNIYTAVIKDKNFLPITIPIEIMRFIRQNVRINNRLEPYKNWINELRTYLNQLWPGKNDLDDGLWAVLVSLSPKPKELLDLNTAIYNMLAEHEHVLYRPKPSPLLPFQRPTIDFTNTSSAADTSSPIPTIIVSAPGYQPPNRVLTRRRGLPGRRVLSVIREKSRSPSPSRVVSPLHSPKGLSGVKACSRTPSPRRTPIHSPPINEVKSPPIPADVSAFIFPS